MTAINFKSRTSESLEYLIEASRDPSVFLGTLGDMINVVDRRSEYRLFVRKYLIKESREISLGRMRRKVQQTLITLIALSAYVWTWLPFHVRFNTQFN